MDLLKLVRDLRNELDTKKHECSRLEQQVTEAVAVSMAMPTFVAEAQEEVSFE